MQMSVNKEPSATLLELEAGEQCVLEHIDLPEEFARRLMELGFLPGHRVTVARSAPGGDPCVFRVDGSEVALRRETAARLRSGKILILPPRKKSGSRRPRQRLASVTVGSSPLP